MVDKIACEVCSEDTAEEGYKLPICAKCRDELSRRPFPKWVKIFFLIILLIFLGAFIALQLQAGTLSLLEHGLSEEVGL